MALIALNTSPKEQTVHITGMSGEWPSFRHVLMASPAAGAPSSQSYTLAPYGVLISTVE